MIIRLHNIKLKFFKQQNKQENEKAAIKLG